MPESAEIQVHDNGEQLLAKASPPARSLAGESVAKAGPYIILKKGYVLSCNGVLSLHVVDLLAAVFVLHRRLLICHLEVHHCR